MVNGVRIITKAFGKTKLDPDTHEQIPGKLGILNILKGMGGWREWNTPLSRMNFGLCFVEENGYGSFPHNTSIIY